MLRLNALDWNYTNDLDAPPDRFSVTFLNSGATANVPGENIPTLGMDHVEIWGEIDESEFRVCEGVVKGWGIAEGPDDTVLTADGIGLKADLIDWRPASPKTYRGMELLSAGTAPLPAGAIYSQQLHSDSVGNPVKAAFFETFQSVAADAVRAVGLEPSFDCADYWLGSEIVWEVDRSANDIITQLAAPFNATERFKLDLHLESNTVRFVERERSVPATMTLPVTWIGTRRVRKSKPKPVNDVQVLGTSFTYPEPPASESRVEWPNPDNEARSETKEYVHKEDAGGQLIGVARTTETRWWDSKGRDTAFASSKVYTLAVYRNLDTGVYATFPRIRREDVVETVTYNGDSDDETLRVRTTFVEDSSAPAFWNPLFSAGSRWEAAPSANGIFQYVEETRTETEYDDDGNPRHSLTIHLLAEEPKWNLVTTGGRAAGYSSADFEILPKWLQTIPASAGGPSKFPGDDSTTPVKTEETEARYFWGGRRPKRNVTRRIYNQLSPATPEFETSWTEIAVGKQATPPVGGSVSSLALRPAPGQVKSGPDNAQLKLSFPTLGTPEDASYFRSKIKQEREKHRYAAELDGPPDLNPQAGLKLQVTTAPVRWQTDTFLVVMKSLRKDADEATMGLRGLAWLDE